MKKILTFILITGVIVFTVVLYYSISNRMRKTREYDDYFSRNVSFNYPIVILTSERLYGVPNCFRVVMASAFINGSIDDEIGQASNICGRMFQEKGVINPNQFFKLNQGEEFYER